LEVKDVFAFYIPNAFTPNSDGRNELFLPKGINIDESSYNFRVFDRWGNQIFYTNDLYEGWNGRINNTSDKVCQQDVYVYLITLKDIGGSSFEYVGTVTLVD